LLTETRQHTHAADGRPLGLGLQAIERSFGRQLLDERARSAVQAAHERAVRLAAAAGGPSEAICLVLAGDLFVCLAVERPWRERDVHDVLRALAGVLGATPDAIAAQTLAAALRAPQLLELPPLVGLEVQLSILAALSPAVEASLWIRDDGGRPECVVAVGETATTRGFRAEAVRTLNGQESCESRGLIVGSPVRRWQAPWAALVVRTPQSGAVDDWLEEAAEALSPLLEREFLLQRSATRERSLVTASERRLSRLGFDLHDGALQHVAALGADIRQLRARSGGHNGTVHALEQRVAELDRVLRELAHSLEPASLLRRPLDRVIESEAAALRERTGIEVRTRVTGDFGSMTQSQKIALIRVVQEALTNIREHSAATAVDVVVTGSRSSVDVQIEDDGQGFEVTRTLQDAAQRGRLGLVGSSERVRLLGGRFDIRSRPGGPTTVSLTLPRWQPLAADEPTLQLAY
jgi:signal transduction histidine kinase